MLSIMKNDIAYRDESSDSWSDDDESSSTSSGSDFFQMVIESSGPKTLPEIKTRGELGLDDLPPIEDLTIAVSEEEMLSIGKIHAIVDKLVVVHALKNMKPLDLDSVLFLSHNKPLGRVYDVFGPVDEPYYCIRFNSNNQINEKNIKIESTVYFAPKRSAITLYVFLDELQKEKGSDASWQYNNEPPEEFLEFSDDEVEKIAKSKQKTKTRKNQINRSSDVPTKRPFLINQGGMTSWLDTFSNKKIQNSTSEKTKVSKAYSSKPSSDKNESASFIPTLVPSMPQDKFSYNYPPPVSVGDQSSVSSPNEEFFIGKETTALPSLFYSPVPPLPVPLNEHIVPSMDTNILPPIIPLSNLPFSKIETVQRHGDGTNAKWFGGNNWVENERRPIPLPPGPPPLRFGAPQHFTPRNNLNSPLLYSSVPLPPPVPLNGQNVPFMNINFPPPITPPPKLPLSKIETVQTHRDDINGYWFGGNNWVENERRPIPLPPGPPPLPFGAPPNHFFGEHNFTPQHFTSRNNWNSGPNRPSQNEHIFKQKNTEFS